MKNWAQQAQEHDQAPNWWGDLLIDHVIQPALMQSILSCPQWGAQMGVIILIKCYLPKYNFFPPQTTPGLPNGECVTCDHCFLHCLPVPPTPTNIPTPWAA